MEPYFGTYSRTNLFNKAATGFESLPKASAPTRRDSIGIAPPPAKESTTSGISPGVPKPMWDALVSARTTFRNSSLFALSQFENSAMRCNNRLRNPRLFSKIDGSLLAALNASKASDDSSFKQFFAHDLSNRFDS